MEAEQKKQAMITALRSLSMGDKSEFDLSEKLRSKGYPESVISHTVDNLKSEGFLGDRAFAYKLSERILSGKKAGTHKLAFEMKKKRIPESIQREVLSAVDIDQQQQQAVEIAERKIQSLKDTDVRILRKKLYDFLIRKGYDFQLAQNTAVSVADQFNRDSSNENE